MALTTSYQAFKTLELLRLRCGLSARESAAHLMCIAEPTYSNLRKALESGTGALSAENDINVCLGLATLISCVDRKLLPVGSKLGGAALKELQRTRFELEAYIREHPAGPGITQQDQMLSMEQLLARARSFSDALLGAS